MTPDAPTPTTPRPPRPERGQELELHIDSLAFGGAGVARFGPDTHGWVVFVRDALPGDTVRAVVTKRKRHYGEARLVEVVTPSPDRVEPKADHPGAPWQVLPYERQLEIKAEQVEDALRRLGHLDGFEMLPIVPAVEQWRYRNKLEFSFGTDETDPARPLICGFHAPGSWEDIVHVEDCLLQSERGNRARREVLEWARSQNLTAYDRRSQLGALRNLVVREGRRTGEVQVRLVVSDGVELDVHSLNAAVESDSLLITSIETAGETTMGGDTELVSGSPTIAEELGGLRFALSSQAFFQTNTEMAEKLYAVAAETAGLQGWERVYDLFCGIGTIGLSLASKSGEVWGLEMVEEAISDAINNAKANEISNVRFFAGDVRLALRELVEKAGRPDVVVVDPPRAGLSQKVVRRILEASPKRIVYVSCNPTTLAPNAAQMVEAGYVLKSVRPVDMFPQTPHIECVALLERGPQANQLAAGEAPSEG
ncbi:MAG TPA: 23S rRNA (uracil(1939)-C(5))-methyltransferase RlmD [Baekduia sp.]|uniref:23S rRNA (uracil(1939)-C(5))-methyltransferase RlmD n=1 Tax=Baekduia sp. TaxID=2600305 RepID=UPI002C35DE10|nr:23S rRNA (uracil(1939)-C(5))-methyltransferase RlmD [Baekduia sp.]HMJ33237.1 23S rRNA (uracil(1939)-C(5))-methyltransferase RlmD [Baekduia sp.]